MFSGLIGFEPGVETERMPTITQRLVSSAKPRAKKYEIACNSLRGFILRVLPSGKKVYYARIRHDGKDIRQRIGPAGQLTFREARARASELLTGALPPEEVRPSRGATPRRSVTPFFRDFVRRYDSGHIEIALKPGTRSRYRSSIRNHLLRPFGKHRIGEITREDVERWRGSMASNPNAGTAALLTLSSIYTKALDWGVLPADFRPPTRGVKKFPARKRERFLSPEERERLEQILDAGMQRGTNEVGYLHWATVGVIRLLSYTGMRCGEVLGLTWDMVDLRHRVFRLPDSKVGQRDVPFGPAVYDLLMDDLMPRKVRGKPWVCVSKFGTPVSKNGVGNAWRRIRVIADLGNMRLHDLRHSAASDALMAGVPLAVVGKILGHRNPSTTARYAHISDTVVRDAVRVMSDKIGGARVKNTSSKKNSE